jgi:hypothetical protein
MAYVFSKPWSDDEKERIIQASDRFKGSYEVSPGGCWQWCGGKQLEYGRFVVDRKGYKAHRVSYFLKYGTLPDILDHICNNKLCVNPSHLRPSTCRENVLRAISPSTINANKTQCIHGHPLSGSNLVVRTVKTGYRAGRTYRACRTCEAERVRIRTINRRAERNKK